MDGYNRALWAWRFKSYTWDELTRVADGKDEVALLADAEIARRISERASTPQ